MNLQPNILLSLIITAIFKVDNYLHFEIHIFCLLFSLNVLLSTDTPEAHSLYQFASCHTDWNNDNRQNEEPDPDCKNMLCGTV